MLFFMLVAIVNGYAFYSICDIICKKLFCDFLGTLYDRIRQTCKLCNLYTIASVSSALYDFS